MLNRSLDPWNLKRMTDETFNRFRTFIETTLGIKMPPSKQIMLETRLGKRLRALRMTTHEEYCDYVFSKEGYQLEIQQLIDVVTTNETDFFRENKHYEFITQKLLPELVKEKKNPLIHIWSVAASTGQEAYTLAMVMEAFEKENKHPFTYKILATDISETVLGIARTGIYTERQSGKIPEQYKRSYCLRSKDLSQKTIRIKPELRQKVQFRRLNLMDTTYPITKKYQIVFCRNVFIYFDRPTQKKVLERIYTHLAPGGYLFMGHSENIGSVKLPLVSVGTAIYKKVE